MFKNLKFSDFLITVLIAVLFTVAGYYYVRADARAEFWAATYPLRATLSLQQLNCSDNSPPWLQEIITYQVKHNNAPSNQIAYIDKAGKLHHCENGYTGEYPVISSAVTDKTRFRYASVTKLWTADAILQLIKDGKLTFDTKLADVLHEINYPKDTRINDITIKQLLLHRAGFDRYSAFGNDMFGIGVQVCPNNLSALNEIQLGFDPNSEMSYSNLGYCLLGEVAERVEGKPFRQLISAEYDFTNSSIKFIDQHKLKDEVFYNYVETGVMGISDVFTEFDYQALSSSAGLSGNAIDLAGQVKSMINKPKPNIKSIDRDLQCDISVLRDCYGYAMFPYQEDSNDKTVYYRDGALLGLSSLVAASEDGSIVVLLSNGTSGNKSNAGTIVKMMVYNEFNKP